MSFSKKEIISKLNIVYWLPWLLFYPVKLLMKRSLYFRTTYLPTFSLFHKLYSKDPANIFFSLMYPVIFIGILGLAMPASSLIPGIGAMTATTISMMIVPMQLVELKKSSLMKKIGSTKISSFNLTSTIFVYYIIVINVASSLTIGLGSVFYSADLDSSGLDLSKVNWGGVFIGINLAILIFMPFGLFVSSIAKNPRMAQLIGMIFSVPMAFLSGQFLPLALIESKEGMKWLSYFIPQRFPTQIVSESFQGGNPFDLNTPYMVVDVDNQWFKIATDPKLQQLVIHNASANEKATFVQNIADALKIENGVVLAAPKIKTIAFIVPFAWMALLWGLALKTFKWGIR